MKKICYDINPYRLKKSHAYKSLSLSEKGIFRELLDILWMSNDQYRIIDDRTRIADLIGCTESDLSRVIATLSKDNDPMIEEEMCLDSGDFFLLSPLLKSQIGTFKQQKAEEENLIRLKMESGSYRYSRSHPKTNSSTHVDGSHVRYIENNDLSCYMYSGWLPTSRFKINGQAYVVRKELTDEIEGAHPGIDLQSEMRNIFEWLRNHPDRRRPLAEMNQFISNWIKNADSRTSAHSLDSLDEELERIIHSGDTF